MISGMHPPLAGDAPAGYRGKPSTEVERPCRQVAVLDDWTLVKAGCRAFYARVASGVLGAGIYLVVAFAGGITGK